MAAIVVVGGNFAGLTAALETRRRLRKVDPRGQHDILVISRSPDFVFVPSLTWVPFGERELSDIMVPIGDVLARHDIEFVEDVATLVDPVENRVETARG